MRLKSTTAFAALGNQLDTLFSYRDAILSAQTVAIVLRSSPTDSVPISVQWNLTDAVKPLALNKVDEEIRRVKDEMMGFIPSFPSDEVPATPIPMEPTPSPEPSVPVVEPTPTP